MSETDSTGLLYFTNQLKFATEAFEELIERLFAKINFEEYGFPIVEAHSLYLAPLRVGDEIEILLMVEKIGESSLQLYSIMNKGNTKVGEVRIKHVLVNRRTGKSTPIPSEWREKLTQDSRGF